MRPLLRVVLKVIYSVDDGNAVVVAAGGGEEEAVKDSLERGSLLW